MRARQIRFLVAACCLVACTDGALDRQVAEAHAAILRDATSRIQMDGRDWDQAAFDFAKCNAWDERCAVVRGP